MRILRSSLLFSQLVSIIIIVVLYFFSVEVFQPEKNYPTHVHKTLFLDRYLSPDEVAFITQAALEWSEATNNIVEFNIVTLPNKNAIITDNDIIILSMSPDHPIIILLDDGQENSTLGYYDDNLPVPSIYLVSSRITEKNYPTVVLHELGHALGLEHNEGLRGVGTLMFPNIIWGAKHITMYDLKKFCKLYQCDASKLKN